MTGVSVIIPCHNAEKTLRACLESVFAQEHRPLEVVVVDDASTDSSPAIARELPCRLVEQPVNRGPSAARNAGVAASSGEVLFFLDSDVALAPTAIANAVTVLAADSSCGCVYGVYAAEPLIDDGPVERYRTLHMHHALSRGAGETASAIFALAAVPRRVFDEIGPFDENLRSAEDDDYSERLLARHRIRLTTAVVGWHDEADRLLPLLAEQFRRAQLMRFSARNRMRRGGLKINRMTGVLAAALAVASLPAGLVLPPLRVLPALFVALFAVADPALSRFVLREKGPCFLVYFTGVHLLTHLAQLSGAGFGLVRSVVDPSFGPARRPHPVEHRKGR
jgi:glycosyltransferase involved in cell wall biosynthesis